MSAQINQSSLTHHRKRVRFSGDDSSEPSISDESALISTSTADESTDASSLNSDSHAELSESSEEPSDDSSSDDDDEDTEMIGSGTDDAVVNLRANRGVKPTMRLDQEELGPDIRSFLKDFLPQLKAANEDLEAQKKAGTLKSMDAGEEEEEEGAPYIEMDLGLGVLEAKDPNAADSSDSQDESTSDETETETDRLGKLMGREKKDAASIEVVQNTSTI